MAARRRFLPFNSCDKTAIPTPAFILKVIFGFYFAKCSLSSSFTISLTVTKAEVFVLLLSQYFSRCCCDALSRRVPLRVAVRPSVCLSVHQTRAGFPLNQSMNQNANTFIYRNMSPATQKRLVTLQAVMSVHVHGGG